MSSFKEVERLVTSTFGLAPIDHWLPRVRQQIELLAKLKKQTSDELLEEAAHSRSTLRLIAEAMTIDESYFMRHTGQYPIFIASLKEKLSQRKDHRPITIWSAGCARGQEPYSIAMQIALEIPNRPDTDIKIIANDLSADAIEFAHAGRYTEWSFRCTNDTIRSRFFSQNSNGAFELEGSIRRAVEFKATSIQEQLATLADGSVDYIFYRNVAIYFTDLARQNVQNGLCRVLKNDGLLFLSPSDPPPRCRLLSPSRDEECVSSSLESGVFSSNSVFRRSKEPRPQGCSCFAGEPSRPKLYSTTVPAYNRKPEPLKSATSLRKKRRVSSDYSTLSAQLLANNGDYSSAIQQASSLIRQRDQESRGHLLRGQILLADGKTEPALEDLRQAVFLEPDDLISRYWYTLALMRARLPKRVLSQVRRLETQLVDTDPSEVLDSVGTTVWEISKAVETIKEQLA